MWVWVIAAMAGPVSVRAALGGQLETQAHGILDAGARGDAWSVQLLTDTLDARAWHQGSRGKVEVGVRGAAFAAGLWISPWREGAPDLTRAHRVAYVGPDLRTQLFLSHGWYGEAMGSVQRHVFTPMEPATVEVADRSWLHGEGTLGGWFADGQRQLRLTGGIDRTWSANGDGLAPFAQLTARWAPSLEDRVMAPRFDTTARVAEDTDAVVATRVGGMTPYHVPLAGAAWAELWVEDVLAVRGALAVKVADGEDRLVLHGALDAVAWTGTSDPLAATEDGVGIGLEAGMRWTRGPVFADVRGGYAPGLPRQAGVWPVPVYFLVGVEGASTR